MNVSNRGCIRRLSLRSLLANRTRNLVAVLAIALTAVLFTSLFTIALSINEGIVVQMTRLWCILCWLWPLVVLQVFHWLGTDKVGPVGAGAALVGIQLGKFFLLPIILFRFKLGPTGFGLTEGISPLFGLLFLCIATRLHKKKQG